MFNFVRDQGRRSASGGLTTGPPEADRGLKFKPDADIGQISADFERERFEIGSYNNMHVSCLYLPGLLKYITSLFKRIKHDLNNPL